MSNVVNLAAFRQKKSLGQTNTPTSTPAAKTSASASPVTYAHYIWHEDLWDFDSAEEFQQYCDYAHTVYSNGPEAFRDVRKLALVLSIVGLIRARAENGRDVAASLCEDITTFASL